MSKIISVNSGSSSLKFKIFQMPEEEVLASGLCERIGFDEALYTLNYKGEKHVKDIRTDGVITVHVAIAEILESLVSYGVVQSLDEIEAAGHRIVQGGSYFNQSVEVTEDVVAKVEELAELAPLHNPAHLICYREFCKFLPNIRHVFVFDTAFHQTMEPESYLFPVPIEWCSDYKIRRYGAHGTSHKYVCERTAEIMGKDIKDINVITCHMGNGVSITAIKGGKVINTSMGLTPLGGVMMGTRCGDIDPSVVYHMMKKLDCDASQMDEILNKKSGLLGISGASSDVRDVLLSAEMGNLKAHIAIDMFANRVINFIGGYFVQLGHVDAITFTAGIGENSDHVRACILRRLEEALQLDIDYDLNHQSRGVEVCLSKPTSRVKVFVVPTNEELVIARDTQRILGL